MELTCGDKEIKILKPHQEPQCSIQTVEGTARFRAKRLTVTSITTWETEEVID